jgi:hypothetical protein
MFHVNRVRWALRKIRLPIAASDLVRDVGLGGNPFPRSDVLLVNALEGTNCISPILQN